MCGGGGNDAPPPPERGGAAEVYSPSTTMPVVIGGQTFQAPRRDVDIPGITEMAYALSSAPLNRPEQQLAGFTPDQEASFELARQGIGSYAPYLEAATGTTLGGLSTLGEAGRGTQQLAGEIPGVVAPGQGAAYGAARDAQRAAQMGMYGLSRTGGMYDPGMVRPFMSPYEDAAVQQALRDIARQGEIAGQDVRARAVASGAYGGSRQAVAEQELQRNVLEQQGRTAAQMRQAGFESAAQRSQAAFEEAQRRSQAAASGIGSLGLQGAQAAGSLGLQGSQLGLAGIQAGLGAQQQAAGIGQATGAMGQQLAGLGAQGQQMNLQDVNILGQVGRQQQQQAQAGLDVAYANQYQQAMMPFQQLAYASDIITGAPSGQSSITTQPGPSIGSQILGMAIGIPSLLRAIG